MSTRREFVTLLGRAAVAWPLAARAQQRARAAHRRADATAETDPESPSRVAAFEQGLAMVGWITGQNVRIDYCWAPASPPNAGLGRELVDLQPDAILASTTPSTAALMRETRTIPIVFVVVSDPVGSGFVASIPRPGGNVAGFTNIESSLGGKWIQLLKEIAPRVKRVALMSIQKRLRLRRTTCVQSKLPPLRLQWSILRSPFEPSLKSNGP